MDVRPVSGFMSWYCTLNTTQRLFVSCRTAAMTYNMYGLYFTSVCRAKPPHRHPHCCYQGDHGNQYVTGEHTESSSGWSQLRLSRLSPELNRTFIQTQLRTGQQRILIKAYSFSSEVINHFLLVLHLKDLNKLAILYILYIS